MTAPDRSPSSDPDPTGDRDHGNAIRARVRPARPGDRAALAAIGAELARPNPGLVDRLLDGVGTVLVSPRADGTPAGYLAAIPGDDVVHVAELAVAPDRRREGRASALLRALGARTDARRVRLAVAPDNRPALECYRSVGFRPVGRDPDYFDGDPAVILEWNVDGDWNGDGDDPDSGPVDPGADPGDPDSGDLDLGSGEPDPDSGDLEP